MWDRPSLCGAARESPKHSSHFGQKHIFQNLLHPSQSTSYKSPIMPPPKKTGWSRQPRAAHCAAPLQERSLCNGGRRVEASTREGRAPSSVCSGISYYLLSRGRRSSCLHHHGNRQSVWVEGGVKLASFLSDNLQRAGLAQAAA